MEIERKYLIEYPNTETLRASSVKVKEITQTYLLGKEGEDRRVRAACSEGKVEYTHTVKTRVSKLSRNEDERVISRSEYLELLREADSDYNTLRKTRYCIPTPSGHTAEIDVYPGISDYAICEIEMKSEEDEVALPPEITLLREVTGEKIYTNRHLAKKNKK